MDDHSRVLVNSSSADRDPAQEPRSQAVGAGIGGAGGETVKEFDEVESEPQHHRNGDRGPRDPWTDARDAARDAWLTVRKS